MGAVLGVCIYNVPCVAAVLTALFSSNSAGRVGVTIAILVVAGAVYDAMGQIVNIMGIPHESEYDDITLSNSFKLQFAFQHLCTSASVQKQPK